MTALSINIADLKRVSDEVAAIIRNDFRGGRKGVLGTERIKVTLSSELYCFWFCALDVCDE